MNHCKIFLLTTSCWLWSIVLIGQKTNLEIELFQQDKLPANGIINIQWNEGKLTDSIFQGSRTYEIGVVLGISDLMGDNISVWPNPVEHGVVSIQLNDPELMNGRFELFNLTGKHLSIFYPSQEEKIFMENLPEMMFLNYSNQLNSVTFKIVNRGPFLLFRVTSTNLNEFIPGKPKGGQETSNGRKSSRSYRVSFLDPSRNLENKDWEISIEQGQTEELHDTLSWTTKNFFIKGTVNKDAYVEVSHDGSVLGMINANNGLLPETELEKRFDKGAGIMLDYVINAPFANAIVGQQQVFPGDVIELDTLLERMYSTGFNDSEATYEIVDTNGNVIASGNTDTQASITARKDSIIADIIGSKSGYFNDTVSQVLKPGLNDVLFSFNALPPIDETDTLYFNAGTTSRDAQIIARLNGNAIDTVYADSDGNVAAQEWVVENINGTANLVLSYSASNAVSEDDVHAVMKNSAVNPIIMNNIYKRLVSASSGVGADHALKDGGIELDTGTVGDELSFTRRANSAEVTEEVSKNNYNGVSRTVTLLPGDNNDVIALVAQYKVTPTITNGSGNAHIYDANGNLLSSGTAGVEQLIERASDDLPNTKIVLSDSSDAYAKSKEMIQSLSPGDNGAVNGELDFMYITKLSNVLPGTNVKWHDFEGQVQGSQLLEGTDEDSLYQESTATQKSVRAILELMNYKNDTINFNNISHGEHTQAADQELEPVENNYSGKVVFADQTADNLDDGLTFIIRTKDGTEHSYSVSNSQHVQDIELTGYYDETDSVQLYFTAASAMAAGKENKVMTVVRSYEQPIASNGNRTDSLKTTIESFLTPSNATDSTFVLSLNTDMYDDAAFKTHVDGGKEWNYSENGKRKMTVNIITNEYDLDMGTPGSAITAAELDGLRERVAIFNQDFWERGIGYKAMEVEVKETGDYDASAGVVNVFYDRTNTQPGNSHLQLITTKPNSYDHGRGFAPQLTGYSANLTGEVFQATNWIRDYMGGIGDLHTDPDLVREDEFVTNTTYVGGQAPSND